MANFKVQGPRAQVPLAWTVTLLIAAVFTVSAEAHGPTPQKVEETIEIAAPPATVWAKVKAFTDIGDWHPGIKSSAAGKDENGGEIRTIILKSNDGELVEGLDYRTEEEMKMGWRLSKENVDAFPVSSYSAAISVEPAGDGSTVRWLARLYRADTTNEPAPGKDDASAVQASSDFIKQGLEGLKAKLEGK